MVSVPKIKKAPKGFSSKDKNLTKVEGASEADDIIPWAIVLLIIERMALLT